MADTATATTGTTTTATAGAGKAIVHTVPLVDLRVLVDSIKLYMSVDEEGEHGRVSFPKTDDLVSLMHGMNESGNKANVWAIFEGDRILMKTFDYNRVVATLDVTLRDAATNAEKAEATAEVAQ